MIYNYIYTINRMVHCTNNATRKKRKTRKNTKGGGKVYSSMLTKPPKIHKKITKKRKGHVAHGKYLKKMSLHRLTQKMKHRKYDITPGDLRNNFKSVILFLEKFIEKNEKIQNSNDNTKKENYSIFLSILSENIYSIVIENSDLISDDYKDDLFNLEKASLYSSEYIENFLRYVIEEDINNQFKNTTKTLFKIKKKLDMGEMNMNNTNKKLEDIQQDYIDLSHFIDEINKAVIHTIKDYYIDLRTKNKINKALDIDDLIRGFTLVKIVNNRNKENNNKNINALNSIFLKLQL